MNILPNNSIHNSDTIVDIGLPAPKVLQLVFDGGHHKGTSYQLLSSVRVHDTVQDHGYFGQQIGRVGRILFVFILVLMLILIVIVLGCPRLHEHP